MAAAQRSEQRWWRLRGSKDDGGSSDIRIKMAGTQGLKQASMTMDRGPKMSFDHGERSENGIEMLRGSPKMEKRS